MPKLTLVAVFYNEEQKLPGFFRNVRGLPDEIVVVDCGSSDRTREICVANKAEVIKSPLRFFETNIHRALEKVNTEWVLILDADERLSPELKADITRAVAVGGADVFLIKRVNFLFDGFVRKSKINAYIPRLFRKGHLVWAKQTSHEKPQIIGKQAKLRGDLFHYAFTGMDVFVKRLYEYAFELPVEFGKIGRKKTSIGEKDWRVALLFGTHGWRMLFLFPLFTVFDMLFLRRLVLDGMRGIVYSLCGGFSSFIYEAAYWEQESRRKHGMKIDWSREYPEK